MMATLAFSGLRNVFYEDISQADLLKLNSSSSEIFRFFKGHFQRLFWKTRPDLCLE